MPHSLNGHIPIQSNHTKSSDADLPQQNLNSTTEKTLTHSDWSYATKELLDSVPRVWSRGLLYFLVIFVGIALPWAMFSKVDETGTARGRLEPLGKIVKLDAPVTGTVANIRVKEGDIVEAGQILVELEAELVKSELQQLQEKLEGQRTRAHQLKLLLSQLKLVHSTQKQQAQAQELEKQAQIEQARQRLETLINSYNLQKQEKQTQINQAKQQLNYSQTAHILAESRLKKAKREVERYRQLLEDQAVPETSLVEQEDIAEEKQRLAEQAASDIEQAKLLIAEQQSSYQKILHQAASDIEQAKLYLQEQQRGYQSLNHSGQLAVLKSEEQLKTLEADITTSVAEIAQTESQINSLKYQLSQRVISAPTDGIVYELPIERAGAVVQPGNAIAEIAPKDSSLILQAEMATTESGYLQPGMSVKMKFDAYPFQDYGVISGKLMEISPTSKLTDTAQGQIATYDLDIELEQNCVTSGSKCIPLRPGDTATAEVIVRQRRVIDFILDPFKKLQQGGLEF